MCLWLSRKLFILVYLQIFPLKRGVKMKFDEEEQYTEEDSEEEF